MPTTSAWLLFLLLISYSHHSCASIGDRSLAYQRCTALCDDAMCTAGAPNSRRLALPLRLTLWSCEDDCSYRCMHNLTDQAVDTTISYEAKTYSLPGLPPNKVVQYHGKWPFYRFMGVQEPFSVLFSLANMYMHVKFGLSLANKLPPDLPSALRRGLLTLPLAGINLWLWSTIFHIRDKAWTEKMDYFSAAASMMCNLYVAVVRLAGLYEDGAGRTGKFHSTIRKLLVSSLIGIFACHTSYLTFWKFDYTYNMAFNVTIGLMHYAIWSLWSFRHATLSKSSRRVQGPAFITRESVQAPHYYKPFLILTLLSCMMSLELLDFPPVLRCLDAHALWHASTIPIVRWWYLCLLEDAWWFVGRKCSSSLKK